MRIKIDELKIIRLQVFLVSNIYIKNIYLTTKNKILGWNSPRCQYLKGVKAYMSIYISSTGYQCYQRISTLLKINWNKVWGKILCSSDNIIVQGSPKGTIIIDINERPLGDLLLESTAERSLKYGLPHVKVRTSPSFICSADRGLQFVCILVVVLHFLVRQLSLSRIICDRKFHGVAARQFKLIGQRLFSGRKREALSTGIVAGRCQALSR